MVFSGIRVFKAKFILNFNVNFLWMMVNKSVILILQVIKKLCFHISTALVIVAYLK